MSDETTRPATAGTKEETTMAKNVYSQYNTKQTPQTEAVPGKTQVKNSAGGYVFEITPWARLNRFLCLGSEGGSYYATEKKLVYENATSIQECLKLDGLQVVKTIVDVSVEGRAPKNDPAVFALAMAAHFGDEPTKAAAFEAVSKVCRIGTHLFQFAEFLKGFQKLQGNRIRRTFGGWYNNRSAEDVAYQVIKYQQRDGWSNRDMLRLAHVKPASPEHDRIYKWVVKDEKFTEKPEHNSLLKIWATEQIQAATSVKDVVKYITEYNLPREVVPTQFLTDKNVWEALLQKMPLTALIRNLGNMSKHGLLTPLSDASKLVTAKLGDQNALRKARIHPIAVLAALMTYGSGKGVRGSGTWETVQSVVDALDSAFYLTFQNVEPTGKNTMLALDVSGSMWGGEIAGIPGLHPALASAALALITAAVEPNAAFYGFSTTFIPLKITAKMSLVEALKAISNLPFAGTDCSLPMIEAQKKGMKVENFAVFTDSETWAGYTHPFQALKQYREHSGLNSRLAVVGMVASQFSIADPSDAGMMDFVGFDTSTPALMNEFFSDKL